MSGDQCGEGDGLPVVVCKKGMGAKEWDVCLYDLCRAGRMRPYEDDD